MNVSDEMTKRCESVTMYVDRHPAGERDRGVARRQARRAAACRAR